MALIFYVHNQEINKLAEYGDLVLMSTLRLLSWNILGLKDSVSFSKKS